MLQMDFQPVLAICNLNLPINALDILFKAVLCLGFEKLACIEDDPFGNFNCSCMLPDYPLPPACLDSLFLRAELKQLESEMFQLRRAIQSIFRMEQLRSGRENHGLYKFYPKTSTNDNGAVDFRLSKKSLQYSILCCVWNMIRKLTDFPVTSSCSISVATDCSALLLTQMDRFVALMESSTILNTSALLFEMFLSFSKLASSLFFLVKILPSDGIERFSLSILKNILLRFSLLWLKTHYKSQSYSLSSALYIWMGVGRIFWGLSIGISLWLNINYQDLLHIWLEHSLKMDYWRLPNSSSKEINFLTIGIASPMECIYLWVSISPKAIMNALLLSSTWERRLGNITLLEDTISVKYNIEDVIWNPFLYMAVSWVLFIGKSQHAYWIDVGCFSFLRNLYLRLLNLNNNGPVVCSSFWQMFLTNSSKLISILGTFSTDLFLWIFEIHSIRLKKREANSLEAEKEDQQFLSFLQMYFFNADLSTQCHSLITKILLLIPRSKYTCSDTDLSEKKGAFWLHVIDFLGTEWIFSEKDGLSDSIVYSIHHSFCKLFLPNETELCFRTLTNISKSTSLDACCIRQFFDSSISNKRMLFVTTTLEQLAYFYGRFKTILAAGSKEHSFFRPVNNVLQEQNSLKLKYCHLFCLFFDSFRAWGFPTLVLVLSNMESLIGIMELLFKCDRKSYMVAISGLCIFFDRVLSLFPDYISCNLIENPFEDSSKRLLLSQIVMKISCEFQPCISVCLCLLYHREPVLPSATLLKIDLARALWTWRKSLSYHC